MKIEVVKKILCLYGYEKINDNEYMFDDEFLNKISIYFKDENTMYLQRSINNMKVINLEEFDDIDRRNDSDQRTNDAKNHGSLFKWQPANANAFSNSISGIPKYIQNHEIRTFCFKCL